MSTEQRERCDKISPDCPLEDTIYGYVPNMGGNAFFGVVFGICTLIQVYFLIRYWRLWKGFTILSTRMLRLRRPDSHVEEPVGRCSYIHPVCPSHGRSIVSRRSTVHDASSFGAVLWRAVYQTSSEALDMAVRYCRYAGVLLTVCRWCYGINDGKVSVSWNCW
ncbi:hypothetical protein LB505_009303 [Fusarium chuoi]|nr:hypothetical protein LB505_009303 [Fusarium chuoi]